MSLYILEQSPCRCRVSVNHTCQGAIEYYILKGDSLCNNEILKASDYVRFEAENTMCWSSRSGGEMFFVLNGKLAVLINEAS